MNKYLVVIGGPTASGKTSTAVRLAQHFDTVILSADSRQFYQEMSIGTAKPTPEELQQAPHYFINNLSIHDNYSVGDFEREALTLLKELYKKHQVVILAGGSGLYIQALCEGLDDYPDTPESIKQQFKTAYEQYGLAYLQQALKKCDPIYYEQVDLQNPSRLIRALSVYEVSGKPFSSFQNQAKTPRFFQPLYFQIEWDRTILYERINQRVDLMFEAGLLEEAKQLYPFKNLNALQTVGYQELFDYFDGLHDLEEAKRLIKRNSRRYAKRQLTWMRRGNWEKVTVEASLLIKKVELNIN